MPYSKTTWSDELPASTPIKYKISQATDGDVATDATIEIVTSVTAGTPVNAANLNKIEDGIDGAIPKDLETAIGQIAYSAASAAWAAPNERARPRAIRERDFFMVLPKSETTIPNGMSA